MLLELILSGIAVYGCAAAYKGGKSLFGGSKSYSVQGRDGKYHYKGKAYDTLAEMSEASWRDSERTRLKHVDFMKSIGLDGPFDEEQLRRNVKEWDEKGL